MELLYWTAKIGVAGATASEASLFLLSSAGLLGQLKSNTNVRGYFNGPVFILTEGFP